mgnify:CR=1 FL=1
MKSTTLDVGGTVSVLDYHCGEKQLRQLRGILQAASNPASNSVSVEYDEAKISVPEIKNRIRECGFHCAGEVVPSHLSH